jgi:hypothetical protein
MFGKHFASMYSGSLFGKPASVFAVLGYIISTMRPSRKDGQCYVELNPTLLAATFASTVDDMLAAINDLCSPDPRSRSKIDDGRRIVPLDPEMHVGPMQFRVVNGSKYRALRDEEERRTYLREAKRKERSSIKSETVNHSQPQSSQVEVEEDVEVEEEGTDNVNGLADFVRPEPDQSKPLESTQTTYAVAVVYQHWQAMMGKPKAKLTPERKRKVLARIKEGYTVDDLRAAVDGCKASDFHQGRDPKSDGKIWDDLELICRDGKHVEQFMALAPASVTAAPKPAPGPAPWERYK